MPKENKRFINPLLRPSQDQLQQNTPSTQTSTSTLAEEPSSPRTDTSPSPTGSSISDYANYPSDTSFVPSSMQAVNESPSSLETDTPAVSQPAPSQPASEPEKTKTSRPAVSTNRSPSRSSNTRSANGKIAASPEPVHETTPSHYPLDERDSDEERTQGYRRRVEVRFEHMHERLTVWIDRDLKRGLEDLASRRNLSKTALINEAMADLLKKHNVE